MSDDLDYWRNNSYPIAFQNHHASFVLSGDGIFIDGYGTGGINGNGNAWYDVEQVNFPIIDRSMTGIDPFVRRQ